MSWSVYSKKIKDSLCLVDKCVLRRHAVFESSQGFGDGFSEYYIRPCHLSVNFFRLARAGILRVGGIVFRTGEERRSNKSIEQTHMVNFQQGSRASDSGRYHADAHVYKVGGIPHLQQYLS